MGKNNKSLREYHSRRNLDRSGEPRGEAGKGKKSTKDRSPQFVIQEHQASSHHYDFRLQVGDVLKSWAVPKGPSTDPREKRLAVMTEDHPLDYARFEGTIPEGEYGAGTVLVWDAGSYDNLSERDGENVSMEEAIDSGHVVVRLSGEKLQGGYALTRIRSGDSGDEGGEKSEWLLVKMDDDQADARRNPTSTERKSVLSGRTLEEVGEEAEASSNGSDEQ
jgi:DNA ligase D-like protein (predicted 3'-phosphoesterase)